MPIKRARGSNRPRKSPIRHTVKPYRKKNGIIVNSYPRGRGIRKRIIIGTPIKFIRTHDSERILNLFNLTYPQYSLIVEAGRFYIDNSEDINNIVSIALQDIPAEYKLEYTLQRMYKHKADIISYLKNKIILGILSNLKFLDKNIASLFFANDLSNALKPFFEVMK